MLGNRRGRQGATEPESCGLWEGDGLEAAPRIGQFCQPPGASPECDVRPLMGASGRSFWRLGKAHLGGSASRARQDGAVWQRRRLLDDMLISITVDRGDLRAPFFHNPERWRTTCMSQLCGGLQGVGDEGSREWMRLFPSTLFGGVSSIPPTG